MSGLMSFSITSSSPLEHYVDGFNGMLYPGYEEATPCWTPELGMDAMSTCSSSHSDEASLTALLMDTLATNPHMSEEMAMHNYLDWLNTVGGVEDTFCVAASEQSDAYLTASLPAITGCGGAIRRPRSSSYASSTCSSDCSGKNRHLQDTSAQLTTCQWGDCSLEFASFSELKMHIDVDHIGKRKQGYACEWRGCQRHGEPFRKRNKLAVHLRVHTNERPYACPYPGCGKYFQRSDALNAHFCVHDDANIMLPCPIGDCDKTYKHIRSLQRHLKSSHDL